MALIKNLKPFKILGPGDQIKDLIETLNWTQEDLASVIGISNKHLNNIIQNKQPISFEIAKLLSRAFGHSTQFWINLDTDYRVKISDESKDEKDVEIKTILYKYMPIAEMMKRGWINKTKDAIELSKSINEFWNEDSVDESFFQKVFYSYAFRKNDSFDTFNIYYAITWMQMAKNLALNGSLPQFNSIGLEELSQQINQFTIKKNGIEEFIKILENNGIKFIFLKHLPKTYLDGATFFSQENPVIAYTGRYNRTDHFWFTISHEIGHILKHLEPNLKEIIDDDRLRDKRSKIEQEADEFASYVLKHKEINEYFGDSIQYVTKPQILECSNKLQIHPGIIIGALAYKKKIDYRHLHFYTEKVHDKLPIPY